MRYLLLVMTILVTPVTATFPNGWKCAITRPCDLTKKQAEQAAIIESLQELVAIQESEITHIREKLSALENVTDALQEENNTTPVNQVPASVFQANMEYNYFNDVVASKNTPLAFTNVLENVGEDYNDTTGYYTAPCDGVYDFKIEFVSSNQHNQLTELAIYVRGQPRCYAFAKGYLDDTVAGRGGCRAVASLDEGETVSVQLSQGNGVIQGSYYTAFSGVLNRCN